MEQFDGVPATTFGRAECAALTGTLLAAFVVISRAGPLSMGGLPFTIHGCGHFQYLYTARRCQWRANDMALVREA